MKSRSKVDSLRVGRECVELSSVRSELHTGDSVRTSRRSRHESIFVGFVECRIDSTTVRTTKIPNLDDTLK